MIGEEGGLAVGTPAPPTVCPTSALCWVRRGSLGLFQNGRKEVLPGGASHPVCFYFSS